MGLKILGRVGTHIVLKKIWNKKIIICILKGIAPFNMHKIIYFPFNMHKIIYFPENIEKKF